MRENSNGGRVGGKSGGWTRERKKREGKEIDKKARWQRQWFYIEGEERRERGRRDKERLVKGSSPYIRAASMVCMVWSSQVKISSVAVCVSEKSKDRRSRASKQAHHPLLSCEQTTPWLSLFRYLSFCQPKVHFCPYCPNCPIVHICQTDRETCHRVQTTIVLLIQSNTVCRLNPRV